MRSADRLPLPAANARPKRNGNHFNNGQKTADDAFALCRARESLVQWYVAGQRVNLLLALSPSALQIDTLTDDEDLLLGFGARRIIHCKRI